MHALAVAPTGDLYIADTWNNRVRKIDANGPDHDRRGGTGEAGFSGDGGPATSAKFGGIYSIALAPDGGTMYLADLDNRRVRAVDLKTGIVTTVAGTAARASRRTGDRAAQSPLVDPRGGASIARGTSTSSNAAATPCAWSIARARSAPSSGTGKAGSSGDGGPARSATLNGPKDLSVDRDGSVLIADTENHAIRTYRPADGTIVRVAGTGKKGREGLGGPPEDAELSQPHGVTVVAPGRSSISDSSNHRILKIDR